jgi:heme/copper-type cytochrome/quinol oxidase subunit 3
MSVEIPYAVKEREDTGLNNGKFGLWLFLASELMLFGALFSAYVLLRTGNPNWSSISGVLNVPIATFNTIVLITSSITMVMAWANLAMKKPGKYKIYMAATILLGCIFLVVKYCRYHFKVSMS